MANALVTTREASVSVQTASMTLAEALQWANEHVNAATGWLLAESPRQIIWRPFAQADLTAHAEEIERLIIFGPAAELRMEKNFGATAGHCRMLLVGGAGGRGTFERVSWQLMETGQRLGYAEHFCQDEDHGILRLAVARFCDVEKGEK